MLALLDRSRAAFYAGLQQAGVPAALAIEDGSRCAQLAGEEGQSEEEEDEEEEEESRHQGGSDSEAAASVAEEPEDEPSDEEVASQHLSSPRPASYLLRCSESRTCQYTSADRK